MTENEDALARMVAQLGLVVQMLANAVERNTHFTDRPLKFSQEIDEVRNAAQYIVNKASRLRKAPEAATGDPRGV